VVWRKRERDVLGAIKGPSPPGTPARIPATAEWPRGGGWTGLRTKKPSLKLGRLAQRDLTDDLSAASYCVSRLLRECLMVRVTARWCFAEKPVYLRGRILPVSVT